MKEYLPGEQPADIDQYIKLNTNENPFPTSERVVEAIKLATNADLRRYPNPTAFKLRNLFANQNELSPENVFVSNGSDEIFTLIFRGFIEKNGIAAFPNPSYTLYDTIAEANGIKFEKVDLEKDFTLDLNKFLNKDFNLVIIANPNNPVGNFTPASEIEKFLNKFTGLLVVDEAYIDFYGGSAINLVNKFDNLIITRTFSKSYSLAGMRIGLAIANRDIIKGFLKIKDSYNVDTLAIEAGKAALLDKKAFNYNIQMVKNNKEYLEEILESLGFFIIPSRGNFLFVKHPDISSKNLYEALKEKKILVRYFSEKPQSEYLRISIGSMMELKELCTQIKITLQA